MKMLKITPESLTKKSIDKLIDCLIQVKYFEPDKKVAKYHRDLIIIEMVNRNQADLVKALIKGL